MDDFKMKVIGSIFNLVGTVITTQMHSTTQYEKTVEDYYGKVSKIVKEYEEEEKKKPKAEQKKVEHKPEQKQEPYTMEKQDLTPDKIEKGIACNACSKEHVSTASGALNEALRFARKEGIGTWEVQKRIGIALDELNNLERIDLSAENIVGLDGEEKQVAIDTANKSRDLRHQINAIKTVDDLERVAASASVVRTHVMKAVFSLATQDGTIDKVCKDLSGDEKERCINTIHKVLITKTETL